MLECIDKDMAAACMALCGLLTVADANAEPDATPHEWLDRMSDAVQTTNYKGTVVRLQDGKAESLKVIHTIKDGVVYEKVSVQEGNGLEIIRKGNEVHCIFPDRKTVLVEEWNDQSTLFSTLPSSDIRFGSEYDVLIKNFERVAGRKTVKLAILPHDNYRYGYRIWLDVETGFPLQTQLLGDDNEPLEAVKFADISIESEILRSALAPSYSIDNWNWFQGRQRSVQREVESDWVSDNVPPGFHVVSTKQEILPHSDDPVTHIRFSDGLASVSVFVASKKDKKTTKRSRDGASNSYTTIIGEHRITAVGEVPAATVEQIASAMRLRD